MYNRCEMCRYSPMILDENKVLQNMQGSFKNVHKKSCEKKLKSLKKSWCSPDLVMGLQAHAVMGLQAHPPP